jgi:hypothetical protein
MGPWRAGEDVGESVGRERRKAALELSAVLLVLV